MPEPIYQRPGDYDLEHEGDTEDVDFFVSLTRRLKPERVLGVACGSGRVTVPLAEAGFSVCGVELVSEMLNQARRRAEDAGPDAQSRLTLLMGDMRTWQAPEPFDLIISPCSSMCHLLTLKDQLAAWRRAYGNLTSGGRFVVDVSMPNLAAYADSFTRPPRSVVEVDHDTQDPETGDRLIRYRTVRYEPHTQRAQVRFLYDKFSRHAAPERYVSDYDSHVYFPRELELLFLHTGFAVEAMYGDYRSRPLGPGARQLIVVGKKPAAS